MTPSFDTICCASLPASALEVLADLRREPAIFVVSRGDRVWVFWEPGQEEVLRRVFPVNGAELYSRRDGLWYRMGHHLPSFDLVPDVESEGRPLHREVLPRPAQVTPPTGPRPEPARLRLARDDRPRAATAMRCWLDELALWADSATSAQIGGLLAARADRAVLLLGRPLPAIPGAPRFWGERVLVPLGFRVEPGLPEAALREALGADEEEVVLLEGDGAERVPREAFRPLVRSAVRLAFEERRA